MTDYFRLKLEREEILKISSLGLAHMGDAVYELMVRAWLCANGGETSRDLHSAAVARVSARAQAAAAEKLATLLTEEEHAVFRRGRNARVHAVPAHATAGQYHAATALECLFGWLYLCGQTERLNELFAAITEEDGHAD